MCIRDRFDAAARRVTLQKRMQTLRERKADVVRRKDILDMLLQAQPDPTPEETQASELVLVEEDAPPEQPEIEVRAPTVPIIGADWSCDQLCAWLQSDVRLSDEYIQEFRSMGITGEDLLAPDMIDDALLQSDFNITSGVVRRRLLRAAGR
eukprot:TRINITY_DN45315_c0_g1_i1.p1 TRINITY_DN45315_c0_g1~~TRINITY_DN45315_c0_g1_i1.p1  ORF type:complete len:151 (+),score=44.69 TRINITY_DN45315_c0_g1_i1:113-565(+)